MSRTTMLATLTAAGLLAGCGGPSETTTTNKPAGTSAERSIGRTVDRYNAGVSRTLGGAAACRELTTRAQDSVATQLGYPTCREAIAALQAASIGKADQPHQIELTRLRVKGSTATAADSAAPSAGSRRLRFVKTGERWKIDRLGVD